MAKNIHFCWFNNRPRIFLVHISITNGSFLCPYELGVDFSFTNDEADNQFGTKGAIFQPLYFAIVLFRLFLFSLSSLSRHIFLRNILPYFSLVNKGLLRCARIVIVCLISCAVKYFFSCLNLNLLAIV